MWNHLSRHLTFSACGKWACTQVCVYEIQLGGEGGGGGSPLCFLHCSQSLEDSSWHTQPVVSRLCLWKHNVIIMSSDAGRWIWVASRGRRLLRSSGMFSCEDPAQLPRGRTISSAWMQMHERHRLLPPISLLLLHHVSCTLTFALLQWRKRACLSIFCAAKHTWMAFFSSWMHAGRRTLEGSTLAHSLLFLAWKREWSSVCLSWVALFCHT